MSLQHSLTVEQSEANIEGIVSRLRARGIQVVLCGRCARRAVLAVKYGASCVTYDRSHLVDGLHLDATGHWIAAAALLPVIEGILTETSSPSHATNGMGSHEK
jgi:hypothetical protein